MTHTHIHTEEPLKPADRQRQQKALRTMVMVLVPIAIWTVVAMIVMWPGNIDEHVQNDSSAYAVPGLTMPTGTLTSVIDHPCEEGTTGSVPGVQSTCATGQVHVDEGPEAGSTVEVQFNNAHWQSGIEAGDKVKLYRAPGIDGQPAAYQFADFERTTPLIFFGVLFVVAVVAVARFRGLMAILGLIFAGFVIIQFVFPSLVAGADPTLTGLVGGSAIMFVVLYTAHGFTARTTTALLGTLFGLGVSAAMGWWATDWAHLTGVASEEDYLLAASAPDLKLTSVVICGVIIAGLGVLNDVTITQASAVWELANNGVRDPRKLFVSGMRIGRDHIASTVYTIAFATAGASLGVLLLITVYQQPLGQVVQTELFSAEILRTVVGTIGLVLAVPLTTAIGVAAVAVGNTGRSAAEEPESDDEDPDGSSEDRPQRAMDDDPALDDDLPTRQHGVPKDSDSGLVRPGDDGDDHGFGRH
ncbi:YibE/F family protein [Propionibacteriaceae bacterium Y1685]|uniref:YibE/F family protein n=1 Tax=Microlunatus sp. Y1700 TaxID=3418487 RepID=UPI003B7D068C